MAGVQANLRTLSHQANLVHCLVGWDKFRGRSLRGEIVTKGQCTSSEDGPDITMGSARALVVDGT